jgi:hypothetical protein
MARNLPMQMPANQAVGLNPNQQFAMLNQQPKKRLGTKIKEGLFGSPGQTQFLPTQTGPQNQLQGLTIQNLMQLLQPGMQSQQNYQSAFAPIAQQATNQFYSQTVPSLAERFTALGGGQNSSAFQGTLAQAGAGLQGDLAAQGAQFGQQQQQLDQNYLLNLLKFAFLPQFETQYQPRTGGLVGNLASGLGSALGGIGQGFGGVVGSRAFNRFIS